MSCHKKLQVSSTLKEGTKVESPNPGQPVSVQPQSETETNVMKGGNYAASVTSHQRSWPGNLISRVCGWEKTEWGNEEREKISARSAWPQLSGVSEKFLACSECAHLLASITSLGENSLRCLRSEQVSQGCRANQTIQGWRWQGEM